MKKCLYLVFLSILFACNNELNNDIVLDKDVKQNQSLSEKAELVLYYQSPTFEAKLKQLNAKSNRGIQIQSSDKELYYSDWEHYVPYYNSNIISIIHTGDLVFDATGVSGLFGHVAIVEGVYSRTFSNGQSGSYIRTIEAIGLGYPVVYGILDDRRRTKEGTLLYHVSGNFSVENVIRFLYGQLGKPYSIRYDQRKSLYNSDSWYCSELVWAAYYYAGVSLDGETSGPITPKACCGLK